MAFSSSTFASVLATDDDLGLLDDETLLGVEFLEQHEGVVRLVIVLEGDGDYVVGVPAAGGRLVGCVVCVAHGRGVTGRRVIGLAHFR